MQVDTMIAHIQEPDRLETVSYRWRESMASVPSGLPSFLDPTVFKSWRQWAGLPESLDTSLETAAARVATDPGLLHLAWHTYCLLFDPDERVEFRGWPVLDRTLGDLHGAFYLLIALAIVPRIRSVHRGLGIPESVTRDTCQVLTCLNWNYGRLNPGRPGILLKELAWVRYHLAGRLFRLGRFEYMVRPFSGPVRVYRHRHTNQVVALAEDGTEFEPDGYRPITGGTSSDSPGRWEARLASDGQQTTGCLVSPYGVALATEVTLALGEWDLVVEPGQPVLDLHIPEGGDMTPDRCIDSMRRAFRFFATHFPDQAVDAIQCHSWILGPQLEAILPSSANLVRFLKELYLFPTRHSPNDGLYYIYGTDDVDVARAPRDTSLQRAVADFLAAGGRWRCGGMFFLKPDLGHFGTQTYRSRWPADLAY